MSKTRPKEASLTGLHTKVTDEVFDNAFRVAAVMTCDRSAIAGPVKAAVAVSWVERVFLIPPPVFGTVEEAHSLHVSNRGTVNGRLSFSTSTGHPNRDINQLLPWANRAHCGLRTTLTLNWSIRDLQ